MSLELLGSSVLGQMGNKSLNETIGSLGVLIQKQIDKLPKPFIFLKSNNNNLSSNVADGVLILGGPQIGFGEKGIVEDFNINYTTAAGTIRLVILNSSNAIVTDLLRDITSSTNGTGKTVLEEGQRLGLVGQTAGAGVLSVYCSGFIQKVN